MNEDRRRFTRWIGPILMILSVLGLGFLIYKLDGEINNKESELKDAEAHIKTTKNTFNSVLNGQVVDAKVRRTLDDNLNYRRELELSDPDGTSIGIYSLDFPYDEDDTGTGAGGL